MQQLHIIVPFFLITLGIYVLLVLPWPGVRKAYRSAYAVVAHTLVNQFMSEELVLFEPRPHDKLQDLDVVLGKRVKQGIAEVPVAMSTGNVGYVPMATLVALIMATPIPWPRKWRALAWGLALVNLFVLFRSVLFLLYCYGAPSPVQMFQLSSFWNRVLSSSYEFLFLAPAFSFIAPVVIWALVTLRTEDLERFVRSSSAKLPQEGSK